MSNDTSTTVKVVYRRKPVAPLISINQPGRLRFANLMALLGVSHQTIYSRIARGEIPPPDGYDGKLPFWFCATIRPLLERGVS
jgi:predicted DNA-binding transcriptional regulator AlpA